MIKSAVTETIIENIVENLLDLDCIKVGNWTLKSGEQSKYYFDIKNVISVPALLRKIGDELYLLLGEFDIICGIPYGALPIATYISTAYNKPLIYVRDKPKAYGTGKLIEGTYKKTDRCVIIDDVITSGRSLEETIQSLKDVVQIVDVAVVMNRQQGYKCSLPVKSLLYKNDVIKYRLKKISADKQSRLCFSADLEDPNKLIEMLNKIGKYSVICKIHYDIINIDSYVGGDFTRDLIECSIKHNFLIMEDRKFVDISHTVQRQYKKFANWVDLVTVMGNVNKDVVRALSGVLLVANMSNNSFDCTENAKQIALENSTNIVGFITQYRIDNNTMLCMTPGISMEKKSIKDQNYRCANDVDTDIIIVGRGIYNDANYIETAKMYM